MDYEEKDDRHERIEPAHKSTFEWIYESRESQETLWPDFGDWLRHGCGIYWICAKAAAGKSTLMKFIHQDRRTKLALGTWANGTPLLILSFYFWRLGGALQKSTKGLYQSLLHQALSAHPALGPVLFPEVYQPDVSWKGFPKIYQLRKAFQRLVAQQVIPLRLLFLIDGLDEFDDAEERLDELGEIFTSIVKATNIKAILSSRPHPDLIDTFSCYPCLHLHDLTRPDITRYVTDKVTMHPRMISLAEDFPAETRNLISEIVASSSGVFLWVILVVRSLLEGLRGFDNLFDLQSRVRELPKDLEDLFRHMLSRVPSQYKKHKSELLRLVQTSHIVSYEYNNEWQPLRALDIYNARLSEAEIAHYAVQPLSAAQIDKRSEEIEGQVRSRCAGLVEIQTPRDTKRALYLNNAHGPVVQYLHKSVVDFFMKPTIWSGVMEGIDQNSIEPSISLLKGLVMRIKTLQSGVANTHADHWKSIAYALRLAHKAETSTGVSQERLLDEIDQALTEQYERHDLRHNGHNPNIFSWCDLLTVYPLEGGYIKLRKSLSPWRTNFLALAIRANLKHYVMVKCERIGNELPRKVGRPLLDYSCWPGTSLSSASFAIDPEITEFLLRSGADPNEKFNGFSSWQNALFACFNKPHEWWLKTVLLLLEHGSDPNAFVQTKLKMGYPKLKDERETRYSALYVLLFMQNRHANFQHSLEAGKLIEAVIGTLRSKKARVYVAEGFRKAYGGMVWEEQVLTSSDAPFLSSSDISSMVKRRQYERAKLKLSSVSRSIRKATEKWTA